MDFKVKTSSFYYFFVCLIFFLNLGFLNIIVNITGITTYISIFITIILFLIFIKQAKNINYYIWLLVYDILLIFYLICQFFRPSGFILNMSEIFRMYSPFLLIFLAFPISEILNSEKRACFFNTIISLGYIALIIKTLYWTLYNFFNINIAPGTIIIDWVRAIGGMELTRLTGVFLGGYLIVTSWYKVLCQYKSKYLIGLIFILFYDVVISQSRGAMIEYIVLSFFILLFHIRRTKNKLINSILITIAFLSLFLLLAPQIVNFINTFSPNNMKYGGSTLTRQRGYQFFFNMWQNNKLWGIGLIPDHIFVNKWLTYYLSDYNFIVNLYEFGFAGFLIMLIPCIYGVRISYLVLKNNKKIDELTYIQLFLTVYIFINFFIQNIYLAQNITLLPLYIAISISTLNEIKEC